MLERHIKAVRTDSPLLEEPAGTRERLRDTLPRNATRRMTQLGLLLAGVLRDFTPAEDDTVVYASTYAEGRALEDYLMSFPTPSPTLFQTSIHPSGVQQVLIARQQPVRSFFPHTGRAQLVAHAAASALLAPTARTLFCGGEERGTWLSEHGVSATESFAFALELTSDPVSAVGRLWLEPSRAESGELALPEFFSALHERQPLTQAAAPGLTLHLQWT
jgi:hypothetical protein